MSATNIWHNCQEQLIQRLNVSEQEANTWLRPLKSELKQDVLSLYAPNAFILEQVNEKYLKTLASLLSETHPQCTLKLSVDPVDKRKDVLGEPVVDVPVAHNLLPEFTFDRYIQGRSNEMAKSAALQVTQRPGAFYNPLVIYGGVGLGKTHLMHAVGHAIHQDNPQLKVVYLHSERFVSDMIKGLQQHAMADFKAKYRAIDVLLIDDIQFLAKKERSQEEFFHTFNALIDAKKQIVLTCDRYPKELEGLDDRLKSRFNWGLSVGIDPPELETRVAILIDKAKREGVDMPQDVAFFIAQIIASNVRELEGALKRVLAYAIFKQEALTVEFAKEALKDLLDVHAKQVSVENIQKVVARHYKLKVDDLLSKSRSRSIARPRQLAMALTKSLTTLSLPEIGRAFGGRDHTTVLHAARKIDALLASDATLKRAFEHCKRLLTT